MNADKIAEIISASSQYAYFGLRIVDEPAEIGEQLAPSFVWSDGEITEDELNGTCAIKIDAENGNIDENIAAALNRAGIYYGQHILVIAGNAMQYGEDSGEIIIRDAECIACWNR